MIAMIRSVFLSFIALCLLGNASMASIHIHQLSRGADDLTCIVCHIQDHQGCIRLDNAAIYVTVPKRVYTRMDIVPLNVAFFDQKQLVRTRAPPQPLS